MTLIFKMYVIELATQRLKNIVGSQGVIWICTTCI